MKRLLKILGLLLIPCALAGAAYKPALDYWRKRHQPVWQQVAVERGRIVEVVNATGTVKPVLSVHIGALVSGPVTKLWVDFNDPVTKDQLLAQIDPQLYDAAVKRDRAALKSREAELRRVEAMLNQARNDEKRGSELRQENPEFISQAELDQLRFNRESLEAQRDLAEAAIDQAQAGLDNSETSLKYTQVISPVDGVVIDRKIDEGQALAAQFQTPELFIVAPDLRKKIYIFASVDESEMGKIQQAKEKRLPVQFAVDAYPEDLFEGEIEEIRLSSVELQNVVTYPVVIAAPNPDLKLLPGMTANISFRVDERLDVLKVPNAALRFYPQEKYVHVDDRKILQGTQWEQGDEESADTQLSAEEKAEARRRRSRRHVWVVEGDFLRAVEVLVGLSDSRFSELITGQLKQGQQLVTGMETKS